MNRDEQVKVRYGAGTYSKRGMASGLVEKCRARATLYLSKDSLDKCFGQEKVKGPPFSNSGAQYKN